MSADVTEMRLKLRDADAVMKLIDEWIVKGLLDPRSAIADARLDYGQPFEYEFTKP